MIDLHELEGNAQDRTEGPNTQYVVMGLIAIAERLERISEQLEPKPYTSPLKVRDNAEA